MAKNGGKGKAPKWGGQEKPTRKEVFFAGFAAGEVVDDAEHAWEAYKKDPANYDPEAEEGTTEPAEPEDPDADEDADDEDDADA